MIAYRVGPNSRSVIRLSDCLFSASIFELKPQTEMYLTKFCLFISTIELCALWVSKESEPSKDCAKTCYYARQKLTKSHMPSTSPVRKATVKLLYFLCHTHSCIWHAYQFSTSCAKNVFCNVLLNQCEYYSYNVARLYLYPFGSDTNWCWHRCLIIRILIWETHLILIKVMISWWCLLTKLPTYSCFVPSIKNDTLGFLNTLTFWQLSFKLELVLI